MISITNCIRRAIESVRCPCITSAFRSLCCCKDNKVRPEPEPEPESAAVEASVPELIAMRNKISKMDDWGSIDRGFVTTLLLDNNLSFDTEDHELVIKGQDLASVKAVFDGKETGASNVFVCEEKSSRDILVKKMMKAQFDREAKERTINDAVGGLRWGDVDQSEMYNILMKKSYSYTVDDGKLIIKDERDEFQTVKSVFSQVKTITKVEFKCTLKDSGYIEVERQHKEFEAYTYVRPLQGHQTVEFKISDATNVIQGTYMKAESDSSFPVLGTFGAGPCLIMAIYCPGTNTAALAHLDAGNTVSSITKLVSEMAADHAVNVHFVGGDSESKDNLNSIYSAVLDLNNVTVINADISRTSAGISASLAIDSRTGTIYSPVIPANLTLEEDLDQQMALVAMNIDLSEKKVTKSKG